MRAAVVPSLLCEYTYPHRKYPGILYIPTRLIFKSWELMRKAGDRFRDGLEIKLGEWKAKGGTPRSTACITEIYPGLQPSACIVLPKMEWLIMLRSKARNHFGQAQEVKTTYIRSSHMYNINSATGRWLINSVMQSSIRGALGKGKRTHCSLARQAKPATCLQFWTFKKQLSVQSYVHCQAVKNMDSLLALHFIIINHYERNLKASVCTAKQSSGDQLFTVGFETNTSAYLWNRLAEATEEFLYTKWKNYSLCSYFTQSSIFLNLYNAYER